MRWLQSVTYILPSPDLTVLQVHCNFTLTHLHLQSLVFAKRCLPLVYFSYFLSGLHNGHTLCFSFDAFFELILGVSNPLSYYQDWEYNVVVCFKFPYRRLLKILTNQRWRIELELDLLNFRCVHDVLWNWKNKKYV